MAVTDAPAGVTKMLGEGLREARQDIHDLKTFVMGMEDRLTEQIASVKDELGSRLDRIETMLEKLISQNGQP